MDKSDLRRGMPAAHRRFETLHEKSGWHGSAEQFGEGAAILLGNLLLIWSGEMWRGSGLPPESLAAAQPVHDHMRTELMCGQYLDLLEQAARREHRSSRPCASRSTRAANTPSSSRCGSAWCWPRAGWSRGWTSCAPRYGTPGRHRVPAARRHPRRVRRPGADRQAGGRRPARGQADDARGPHAGRGLRTPRRARCAACSATRHLDERRRGRPARDHRGHRRAAASART